MTNNNLQPQERLAYWAVILGGIIALVLGFSYLGERIKEPHRLKPGSYQLPSEKEAASEAALKTKDTDSDGLFDYDEINIWNTSPYLADSDSDGFDDKTEIESGNNPNCPQGKECGQSTITPAPDSAAAGLALPAPPSLELPASQSQVKEALGKLTPAQIRQLLIEQGLPKETLDQVDDQTLMEIYQQSLEEAEDNSAAP